MSNGRCEMGDGKMGTGNWKLEIGSLRSGELEKGRNGESVRWGN